MYIIDGIAYSDNPEPPLKVISVRPMNGHKLWLRFSTGEEKICDFTPFLEYPCFKPLENEGLFQKVYIEYGVPVWQDGAIDISPNTLYQAGEIPHMMESIRDGVNTPLSDCVSLDEVWSDI